VVLAVIGTRWAGETDSHRRIDEARDFVRIEIESALRRDIPLIPVLVDHARMPDDASLASSLAELAFRNAIEMEQGCDFRVSPSGARSRPRSCHPTSAAEALSWTRSPWDRTAASTCLMVQTPCCIASH
jgi:hypothetical protein